MVKIKLDEEWSINDYGSHYELVKFTGKTQEIKEKSGKVRVNQIYDHQSYPPSLEAAIRSYIRRKGAEIEDEVTLNIYVDRFEKANQLIREDLRKRGFLE